MILLADSGSTKITWCQLNRTTGEKQFAETTGINPFYQEEKTIVAALNQEFNFPGRDFEAIYFYSAGCANPVISKVVSTALSRFFKTEQLYVESDLMAAARALCGDREGIACILGTGSNSCYYDGQQIKENVSPLGFILGDEGSGAVIGKKLLSDVLKRQFPQHIIDAFFDTYKITAAEILDNIYKKPFPNRYAAGFTKFIAEYKADPSMQNLLFTSFEEFLIRNVLQYSKAYELPVHFTGSIAHFFSDTLEKALDKHNLIVGNIIKDPIERLVDFHLR